MHPKVWWRNLFLATVAACQVGMWGSHRAMWWRPGDERTLGDHHLLLTDMALMLLPVVCLVLRGLVAALRQVQHTRRVVYRLRTYAAAPVPPALQAQAQRLRIAERLDVVVGGRAEAFCYGFLRPRICISTGLLAVLQGAEVEAVLRHERHHLRRRDPLRVLGWTLLRGACSWLTPYAAHADLVRELAADRAVIGEQGRAPLARALLTLVNQPRDAQLRGLAVSGVSVTEARIDQLLTPEKDIPPTSTPLLRRWMFGALALLVYVVGCSVVMSVML